MRRSPPTRGSWARCPLSIASSPDRRSCSLSRRWFLRAFVLLVTISARYRRRSTPAGSEDNEIRRRRKYAERVSTPVGWEFSLARTFRYLGFWFLSQSFSFRFWCLVWRWRYSPHSSLCERTGYLVGVLGDVPHTPVNFPGYRQHFRL